MGRLKVLSIDWDFLVSATLEQRMMIFPDCCNEKYPAYLQDIIWSSRYASHRELEEISLDEYSLNLVKKFISNTCDKSTFCTVWDSHSNLYDEITSRTRGTGSLEVVNIDFHHDMYGNELGEVDCGNWVNYLFEKGYGKPNEKRHNPHPEDKYYWVARSDSDESTEYKSYMTKLEVEQLQDIPISHFDLLFICRSSMWSPPHLDDSFTKFYRWVNDNITRAEINVTPSRYSKEFKKSVNNSRIQIEEITN